MLTMLTNNWVCFDVLQVELTVHWHIQVTCHHDYHEPEECFERLMIKTAVCSRSAMKSGSTSGN